VVETKGRSPDERELALDSLDVLGLIVADEIAETRISMASYGVDKGKRF
jgi:hypothetical protein